MSPSTPRPDTRTLHDALPISIQHATSYAWLSLRSALVPIQNVSGKILNIVLIAALFGGIALFGLPYEAVGVIVVGSYGILTLFTFVTLPVEFDARSEERRVGKECRFSG